MHTRVRCESVGMSCEEEHGCQCHGGHFDLENHLWTGVDNLDGMQVVACKCASVVCWMSGPELTGFYT